MAAVAIAVIDAFGVGPGSNIGRGLFVTLTYTATIFDKMVIAGAGSITARGLIERVGMVEVLWSQWALAFLPLDIITILLAWRLTLWLYPPEREEPVAGAAFLDAELRRMGPLSAMEKRAAVLMLLATGLWVTDFIHHIPAAMIGMGVGLLAVMPRIGVLDIEDVRKVNYLIIVFVGAAISTGDILRETGALKVLTDSAFGWLQPFIVTGNVDLDDGPLLDRVRLPSLPRRRNLDARDVDSRAHAGRAHARRQSALAGHGLDVQRGRENLPLPDGGAHRGVFVRILHPEGHAPDGTCR